MTEIALKELAATVVKHYGTLATYEDVELVAGDIELDDDDFDFVLDLITTAVVDVCWGVEPAHYLGYEQ